MDVSQIFTDLFSVISPILTVAGLLALAISLIVMLVNMLINAFTGKGFTIGLK